MSRSARILLQLEGAVVLVASVWAYREFGAGWILFAVLLLGPDVSMLGYLRGPATGAWVYNVAHTYLAPALLVALGLAGVFDWGMAVGLIWLAHIGMDRALGYGLKHPKGFRFTHLAGHVGAADVP